MSQLPPSLLARPDFGDIPRHEPSPDVEINLAENTNLWGTPPSARAAITRFGTRGVAGYPDMYGQSLKDTVAEMAKVPSSCVVTGNGSDDLLDCAVRAFAVPGDRIAHPNPTFVMLPVFARINSIVPVPVPLTGNFENDIDALLAVDARITYLCSPNNPIPVATDPARLRDAIARSRGLVILDEAYAEFAGENGILHDAPALERVLVCRTLSKAYGLAGLRVGYATASESIVTTMETSRGPFKLNALAEHAAVAAMTSDRAWVEAHAREAVVNRDRLAAELTSRGFSVLPSAANFLLVPTPTAFDIAARLRARGIAVRPFRDLPALGDAMRITVGPWEIMQRLLNAMDA